MAGANPHLDLTPWKPTPTRIPAEWMKLAETLAQEVKGSQRAYVMKVKYDAQRVGNMLRSWGLPWQVVMAGYLWGYDKDLILQTNLEDVDEVLCHISEANLYAKYIEDENLPPLLSPPYRDLGGLLIAIAISYQALRVLQEQSNEKTYTGAMQSQIESVVRTMLNITKSLGMWHFKRDVEDLAEQLRSPRKFVELKKEHTCILEQDALILEEIRQSLIASYQEATKQPITVLCTPCGIAGLKRRLQDAHTTAILSKPQLNAFDLVTFDVIVPTVQDCYSVFGVLSQLGHIQDQA
jgi:(p)ppGpp synthase/HD superfamily hydrolase